MNLPPKTLQQFFDTAFERHRIYILKESGAPKPWTKNKIFQANYFCNVFRRIDKTSDWIIQNVIEPGRESHTLWKRIIIARYISRIPTLERILEAGGFEDFGECLRVLRGMQGAKEKIMTNAFIVNSKTSTGYADKVTHLFRTIRHFMDAYPMMDEYLKSEYTTLQGTYNRLLNAPGCGAFMSYQYVCDFAYSERYLKDTSDTYTWTQLGLGAMRGINRILQNANIRGRVPNSRECAMELLYQWRQYCTPAILDREVERLCEYPKLPDWSVTDAYDLFQDLKMCDVQHWLCEYDKFMRGGSKKRKYDGGTSK